MVLVVFRAFFFVAYPPLVHFSIHYEKPLLIALAIISVTIGVLFNRLKPGQPSFFKSWVIVVGIAFAVLLFSLTGGAIYLVYIPPVAIPMIFAAIFIQSLLPGRLPLVTEIGERSRGPLSPAMVRYTGGVTVFWSVLLAMMVLESLLLPWFVSPVIWSALTGFVNYTVIALVFFIEYLLRRALFPDHDHPNFYDYIQIVIAHDPRRKHA